MTDRTKYEKLDDIGILGTQEEKSAASRRYQQRKTGEIFRRARVASMAGAVKVKKTTSTK